MGQEKKSNYIEAFKQRNNSTVKCIPQEKHSEKYTRLYF